MLDSECRITVVLTFYNVFSFCIPQGLNHDQKLDRDVLLYRSYVAQVRQCVRGTHLAQNSGD